MLLCGGAGAYLSSSPRARWMKKFCSTCFRTDCCSTALAMDNWVPRQGRQTGRSKQTGRRDRPGGPSTQTRQGPPGYYFPALPSV